MLSTLYILKTTCQFGRSCQFLAIKCHFWGRSCQFFTQKAAGPNICIRLLLTVAASSSTTK